MCNQFQDRADFYVIYIAEAHATDEWQLGINEQESVLLPQHRQFEERLAAARLCAEALQLHMPTLVDGMDNAASTLFAAWPERIYILDKGGVVHYRGGYGPFDFKPDEAAISLAELLSE
ncbi:MAG: hypothetical protein H6658_13600 [Ardenticatenaceae bacterium]|nr:hypothetical protein [Ardenticatenaceae bacterium]